MKGRNVLAGNSYNKWEDTSSVNHILVLIWNTTTGRIMNLQDQQFSFFLVLMACLLRINLCSVPSLSA